MASFRIVPALQTFILILAAVLAVAAAPACVAQTVVSTAPADFDPPTVVIDAEYVPAQAVGYVVYVPNEQDMLAVDAASGSIRAVVPAPPRPMHTSTGLAALTAGSVSIPTYGIILLATLFLGMVGIVFFRRVPINA
jgi:hypothetical protein